MGIPFPTEVLSSLSDTIAGKTAEFVNTATGMPRTVLQAYDAVTGNDTQGWARDRDIQQAGNDQRSNLSNELDRESRALDSKGVLDPAVGPHMENFDSMDHSEIKRLVETLNPGSVLESAQSWRKAEQMMTQLSGTFRNDIQNIIAADWEGDAATRAQSAVNTYVSESDNLGHALNIVGSKLEWAYTGFDQTKRTLPEPDSRSFADILRGGAMTVLGMPGGISKIVDDGNEAQAQAREIMNTVYKPVVYETDSGVPKLPAAYNPIANPSGDRPGDPSIPGGTPPQIHPTIDGKQQGVEPRTPSGVGQQPNDQTSPASTDPAAQVPNSNQGAGQPAAGLPGAGSSAGDQTRSTGVTSPLAASVGSGGGAGLGGGSGSGMGGGAGGRPLGGPSLGSGSLAAGAVPGPGGGPGGSAAAAGRAGAPGGGMAPGAGKGKGDDDKEHKTPSYLVSVDNGNELIGELPKVAPPVLGG